MDQHAVGRGGIEVEDLLPQRIGEGRVRDKRETPGLRPLDSLGDVRHDIAHMVHDQRVFGDVTGVAGLDELRFHLAEMHKGVAPAAGHGTTALHRATTGVFGPEPVLEPRDGLVQIVYQIANVLNLVKHDAVLRLQSLRCSRKRIIDPFTLGPKPTVTLRWGPTCDTVLGQQLQ